MIITIMHKNQETGRETLCSDIQLPCTALDLFFKCAEYPELRKAGCNFFPSDSDAKLKEGGRDVGWEEIWFCHFSGCKA